MLVAKWNGDISKAGASATPAEQHPRNIKSCPKKTTA